ncbi:MAG: hypothetical protein V1792_01030 [Pseudomonadota bacterium]
MRPPRIHSPNTTRIALAAIVFLMLLSWTVILASAQDETPQQTLKQGTVLQKAKLIVQKIEPRLLQLSGGVYLYSGATDFLDTSGEKISRNSIPVGSVVNIVYMTDKDTAEDYPFHVKDKVLIKVQVAATTAK